MDELSRLVQPFSASLDKYLLADNPQAFLDSLPKDSMESKFINFLRQPYSDDQQRLNDIKQLGLPSSVIETITANQMIQMLKEQIGEKQKLNIINNIQKRYKIKFNHTKPIDNQSIQSQKVQNVLPSQLIISEDIKKVILEEATKAKNLNTIQDYGLLLLNNEQLNSLSKNKKEQLLERSNIVNRYDQDFIVKLIKYFYQENKKTNSKTKLPNLFEKTLSKNQIIKLKETIPELFNEEKYFGRWISIKLDDKINLLQSEQQLKRRNVFIEIRKEIKQFKTLISKKLDYQILKEMLTIDIIIEKPNKELFFQFFQNMVSHPRLFLPQYFQILKAKNNYQNNNYNLSKQPFNYSFHNWDEQEIIIKSMQLLFKEQNSKELLEQLIKFFDNKKITKIWCKIQLAKGNNVLGVDKILKNNEIIQLKNAKEITFRKMDKKKYKVDEDVILKLKIKNIQRIKVKIYQIQLQKKIQISGNIYNIGQQNTSYLDPMISFNCQIDNSNPFKQNYYDLPINEIEKRPGSYIIDLEGEGISSRAVIRKGSIICLTATTLAGEQLKFYNEEGKKLQNITLWIKGTKFNVKDQYIIPFGNKLQTYNIVSVKDSYVGYHQVKVCQQSYNLTADFLYTNESFIVGNKAQIIISPRLTALNNKKISLKLLKNNKIIVTIIDNHDVKTFIPFQNIQWTNSEDYLLQFPIQAYTKAIKIDVQSQIEYYNKQIIKKSASHQIKIDLLEKTLFKMDAYLTKNSRGYQINFLGLNGEPIANIHVKLVYFLKYIKQPREIQLCSDLLGKIYLNSLATVTMIKIMFGDIKRIWDISKYESQCPLSSQLGIIKNINAKEGDKISLPIPQSLTLKDLTLFKSVNQVKDNLSQKLSVVKGRVQVSGLQAGNYVLQVIKLNIKLPIEVLKGGTFEQNKSKIYNPQNSTIYQLSREPNNTISIGKGQFENKQTYTEVNIQLNVNQQIKKDNLRVHCFATNFIPSELQQFDLLSSQFQTNYYQTIKFTYPQCCYMNNKKLSDEGAYVLNREKQSKFIGNNLQKPKIFLKRISVRQTDNVQQQLAEQQQYRNQKMSRNRHMKQEVLKSASMKRSSMNIMQKQKVALKNILNSHNNFLMMPCASFTNIKDTKIKLKIPKGYQNIKVIAINDNCKLEKSYTLNNSDHITTKNLRHTGLKQSSDSTGWAMSRECYSLQKGQSIKVNRNSQWCAVSLFNICNFAKIKGVILDDWLMNWQNYTYDKKLSIYDKQYCHQLNVYIHQNDQQFFTKVVKPFIQNKMVKSFVDLYLLEDEQCLQFLKIHKFKELNEFEKILLIKRLVKVGRKQQAKNIAQSMTLIQKTNNISFNKFDAQFDTIINAKQDDKPRKQLFEDKKKKKKGNARQQLQKQYINTDQRASMSFGQQKCLERAVLQQDDDDDDQRFMNIRKNYKEGFKQMQKTKQYVQVTYNKVKDPFELKQIIQPSSYWAKLANHIFIDNQNDFLTQSFMYLKTKPQFTLALCFVPNNLNSNFDIVNDGENYVLTAKSSFLVFIKQVKSLKYEKKFGVMINERFFDPEDQWSYEQDGTKLDKQVQQFIRGKIYKLQTVVTNTSGTSLEMQILVDIPEGSIPIQSNQCTKIINSIINGYSTKSFQRYFYFPNQGDYTIYPANVCRNKLIIAKSVVPNIIEVKKYPTIIKMDTLSNVMRSGNQQAIIQYVKTKNIFDQDIFDPEAILWMLKDRAFFQKIIQTLKCRMYYNRNVWSYGILHKNIKITLQYIHEAYNYIFLNRPSFEYFPYYSSRCHQFQNQNKSNIRNKQFKQTFYQFIIISIIQNNRSAAYKLTLAYYLILQDRIDDAVKLCSSLSQNERLKHKIQIDYIECFIDICQGYPNFIKARKISAEYQNYPIASWRKLFEEVLQILKQFDDDSCVEEKIKIEYSTKVVKDNDIIRISIPSQTEVRVLYYSINIQMYFSMFPFKQFDFSQPMKPTSFEILKAGQNRQQKLIRPQNIKDAFVVVEQIKEGSMPTRITSLHWQNPNIKVQLKQQLGIVKAYYKGKKIPGCYCKVFSKGNNGEKFYRDGYTDITGSFKYVMGELQGIKNFSILLMTENGGITVKANIPNTLGSIIS